MEENTSKPTLIWPDKVVAHADDWRVQRATSPVIYRDPTPDGRDEEDPYGSHHRTCGYCGSIHPGDLYNLLTNPDLQVKLGGSDWKYGWPHKFYVEKIPNTKVGKQVSVAGAYCGSWTRDDAVAEAEKQGVPYRISEEKHGDRTSFGIRYLGPAPAYTSAKFYNVHIKDILDKETRDVFCNLLLERGGIAFRLNDEGVLEYVAPYRGYQA